MLLVRSSYTIILVVNVLHFTKKVEREIIFLDTVILEPYFNKIIWFVKKKQKTGVPRNELYKININLTKCSFHMFGLKLIIYYKSRSRTK